MREIMRNALRLMSIPVFVVGLLAAGMIYYFKSYASQPKPQTGFTLITSQVFTPKTGKPLLSAIIVRYQRSDGAFKQVTTYYRPDGSVAKVDSGFGQPGRGVFQVDESKQTLNLLSPSSPTVPFFSESALQSDPRFAREEYVSGYKTYVLRRTYPNRGYGES